MFFSKNYPPGNEKTYPTKRVSAGKSSTQKSRITGKLEKLLLGAGFSTTPSWKIYAQIKLDHLPLNWIMKNVVLKPPPRIIN